MGKIGILGCAGRMGRMLVQEVSDHPKAILIGGVEASGHPLLGEDLGRLVGGGNFGLKVTADSDALFADADAVIDFTHPSALESHLALAIKHGAALVVGTTGLDAAALVKLAAAAQHTAIVRSANMSVGVTLLTAIVQQMAGQLDAKDFDIEITEMHHRHKIDAPSGTALALGEAAAAGRGVALPAVWRKSRDGQVGVRPVGEIGFASLRGGDVVGDHKVIFAADGERIEISHKASSRQIFARGAVRAALWAAGRAPGLYDMKQVLGV